MKYWNLEAQPFRAEMGGLKCGSTCFHSRYFSIILLILGCYNCERSSLMELLLIIMILITSERDIKQQIYMITSEIDKSYWGSKRLLMEFLMKTLICIWIPLTLSLQKSLQHHRKPVVMTMRQWSNSKKLRRKPLISLLKNCLSRIGKNSSSGSFSAEENKAERVL